MNFRENFPLLSDFIGSWFPDADLEGTSDEDVARRFCGVTPAERRRAVVSEAHRAVAQMADYWTDLSREANRHFETPEEARKWLSEVIRLLDE